MKRTAFTLTALALSVLSTEAWSTEAWADDAKPAPVATSDAKPDAKADAKAEAKSESGEEKKEVLLHVASPTPVRIENSDTGEVVCTSPCDKNVPSTLRYRIGAGGFGRPSSEFVLTAQDGKADLKVKPARRSSFWTGVGALGLGGALIAGGVAVLAYGVGDRHQVNGADGETTNNSFTDLMAVGTGITILGAVSAIWGAATVITNASTRVDGDVAEAPRSSSSRAELAPVVRTALQQSSAGLPRPTYVPILGGTF